ncbi:hypothetical protein [Sulfuricurvum sp.]|uniref:hypothetical protein n=1 Tax=Sulfuricurvum sp. TaxID=2025608 RepID=UPI003C50A415
MNNNFIFIFVITFFFTIPAVFGMAFEASEPDVPPAGLDYVSSNQSVFEHNTTFPDYSSAGNWGIDSFQDYWSHKILRFSSYLDHVLSTFYMDANNLLICDANATNQLNVNADTNVIPCYTISEIEQKKAKETYLASIWLDEFFKDGNYLDMTNRSYVLVRGGYEYDRRGDSSIFYNIKARIKLPKTQGKVQLFIGDDTPESINLSNAQYSSNNEGIGLKYYTPGLFEHLHTSAAIGFSRIDNPYVKTRIESPIFSGNWLFKPIQEFKFSHENEFEEWTNLYFDRKLSDSEILRLLLQRSTKSGVRGMNYLAQLSYMNTLKYEIGFNHYIGMSGRTKDQSGTAYIDGTTPQEGIYEYSVGTIWRQKLLNDYLFYQIQPIVSFHEQYNFKPDYIFRFSLDFYFGSQR